MKKILSVLLLGAMLLGTLASCGGDEETTTTAAAKNSATVSDSTNPSGDETGDDETPGDDDDVPDTDGDVDPEPEWVAETPMVGADVITWMADNEGRYANGLIDQESVFTPTGGLFGDGGPENMFDDVFTEEEWNTATAEGRFEEATEVVVNDDGTTTSYIHLGKTGVFGSNLILYWSMTEPVTLTDYVIYTGNDNADWPGRIPVEWSFYGSNTAPDKELPFTDKNAFEEAGWVELDYVYDSAMADANFAPHGYSFDEDKQGEYQYYCLFISDGGWSVTIDETTGEEVTNNAGLMQMTGMKLYKK